MTPELRERLARAVSLSLGYSSVMFRLEHPKMLSVVDAILSELTAAGYAVVTQDYLDRLHAAIKGGIAEAVEQAQSAAESPTAQDKPIPTRPAWADDEQAT